MFKEDFVDIIRNYYLARIEIESKFHGIPHVHSLLIRNLIALADLQTGIVQGITYNELCCSLTIHPAPGRKESGTPSKQTIRNYIKSIERECGEYFKVISEGQTLKFLFPEIPRVFSKLIENTEVNTEVNSSQNLTYTEQNELLNKQNDIELNTDANTPNNAVKNIYNKINNNNMGKVIRNLSTQKPIPKNFYPSQETISRAIAAGHNNAADPQIIQEFVDKNTAWGSTFSDFNPIYLVFLAKHAERQKQLSSTQNRSKNNERTSSKVSSYDAALEAVRRNNQSASNPSTNELFPSSKEGGCEFEHESRVVALGRINQNLRGSISY